MVDGGGRAEAPSGGRPRVLVAACGNRMRGDDAFGPAVADALSGEPGLEIVDLGMRPAALLDHLADHDTLVIVDAMRLPAARPGTLLVTGWDAPDRPPILHDDPLSSHGLCIGRQLELARSLGSLPERVLLVGVAIDSPEPGSPMSPSVRRRVAAAAGWIRRREWLRDGPVPATGSG